MKNKQSSLIFVLKALAPYSRENLMLSYKPNKFFYELEKVSKYKESALRSAYWRAHHQGLIKRRHNLPYLTQKGRHKVQPFIAENLKGKAKLMIIFDIPETRNYDRRKLRTVLKEWQFKQVQKSVWITDRDFRTELIEVIDDLKLQNSVQLYECVRQFP